MAKRQGFSGQAPGCGSIRDVSQRVRQEPVGDGAEALEGAVLTHVIRVGAVITRVRERSSRDEHVLVEPTVARTRWHASDDAVVAVLTRLEARGRIRRIERVHPFDSSEFTVSWTAARSGHTSGIDDIHELRS